MKILFLTDNFYPETNAAASRVYERAIHWVKEGHEVTLITCCPNFPEGRPFEGYRNCWRNVEYFDGMRVVRVKTYMAANKGVFRRLLDFISFMFSSFLFSFFEEKPDVVMASSPQFFTAISGYLVSLFKRVPYGLEIADLWPESIRAVDAVKGSLFLDFMEKVELFLYRKSDFIIALTPSIKMSMVKRGIDESKIVTVINGVNLDFFKQQKVKDESLVKELQLKDKFVVGYIGTFGMAHNLLNLLKAAKLLRESESDIHFLLVGAGAEKERLREYTRDENLFNVSIVQRQPKEEIPRYWSLCDLAVVHLKDEDTFKTVIPSKIFEAMGVGKPILYCGPESDGSLIVTKEGAGVRVDSSGAEKLAEVIKTLKDDPLTLEQMKFHSAEAAKHYSRKKQADSILKTISQYCLAEKLDEAVEKSPLNSR